MMKLIFVALVVGALIAVFGFAHQQDHRQLPSPPVPQGMKQLVVAGGCFWCLDSMYRQLQGVVSVESGYANGNRPGLTYEQVCSGTTGAAEAVKITYDPKVISGDDLLRIFFTIHNPTTLNRQGEDAGTQYRSAIFYTNAEQKALAEKIKAEIAAKKIWDAPLVTAIEPLKSYTRAEEYHQDYYEKFEKATPEERAEMNVGYCQAIISPKVVHFREMYAKRLKKH